MFHMGSCKEDKEGSFCIDGAWPRVQAARPHLPGVDADEREPALHWAEEHVRAAPARHPPCTQAWQLRVSGLRSRV